MYLGGCLLVAAMWRLGLSVVGPAVKVLVSGAAPRLVTALVLMVEHMQQRQIFAARTRQVAYIRAVEVRQVQLELALMGLWLVAASVVRGEVSVLARQFVAEVSELQRAAQ